MAAVRILPIRTMQLGGQRVEAGVPADVPAADAELALRHGWATAAPVAASPAEAPADKPVAEAPKKSRAAKGS